MDFVTPCQDAKGYAMRCEISDIVERVGHKSWIQENARQ